MQSVLIRIPEEDYEEVKSLVGHDGNRSANEIYAKAVKEYLERQRQKKLK